ncbi:hypothetical protein VM1G_11461 [Cytospora mali]|uniref:Uncharacterized protein n=1 Tax=Cytospora mali TaxID=578113 RepID=A0A194VU66_CYTMA|nr:hypothetical protein VM1G_11461 [Valsa mali]
MDEQYWKCEVEALKPYRYQKEYEVRHERSREESSQSSPKPTAPSQSTRAPRARQDARLPKAPARKRQRTTSVAALACRIRRHGNMQSLSIVLRQQ